MVNPTVFDVHVAVYIVFNWTISSKMYQCCDMAY